MAAQRPEAERAIRILRRMAQALDLPVERLLASDDDCDGTGEFEQTVELVRLFRRVRDIQARRRCIAFVRHSVETDGTSSPNDIMPSVPFGVGM